MTKALIPEEYGLQGLVISIGSVIGVSQHLGIVDGAIREIAILKDKRAIAKVFWVSHLVRQTITLPLSVALMLLAHSIAAHYRHPEITPYIQIFAGSLILQGLQDVLGATLTGTKKFGNLYVVQIATALINVAVFGYFTWRWNLSGFFWAMILTTSIMVSWFAILIARDLRGNLALPTLTDIRTYGRRVMRVGAFMYIARIFFVVWQRSPFLVLGGFLSATELGYLNISLTFGSQLTIIAAALAEVNLAWMSSIYGEKRESFRRVVTRNMHQVLVFMTTVTLALLLFTPEILHIFFRAYVPAEHVIMVVTLAFFLYSLSDIGTSSVFVPADEPRLRTILYGGMAGVTAAILGGLMYWQPTPLLAGYTVVIGALVSYVGMVVIGQRKFHVSFLTGPLAVFLVLLGVTVGWLFTDPALEWRVLVFITLMAYLIYQAHRNQLLPRSIFGQRNLPAALLQVRNVPAIVCFAGAAFDQPTWTNRQHVMSRVSKEFPVLYVEPRVWIVRQLVRSWRKPQRMRKYLRRLVSYERKHPRLFIKSQWNVLPGSREFKAIARFNHWLNRRAVLNTIRQLGFSEDRLIVWLYDTEAAEFLSAFPTQTVVYDCVDDHAAQAGVDRNSARVHEEEKKIMEQADLVTVTSRRLLELKQPFNGNTHLVLNAGDVSLFSRPSQHIPAAIQRLRRPIIGLVGALDSYKVDFALVDAIAAARPDWQIILLGAPVVDQASKKLAALLRRSNVHLVGSVPREQVPDYAYQFDVCLIPYLPNRYNEASFPLKFWELMATGKPIVVSGVPELKTYRDLISYGESKAEVIAAIHTWLANPTRLALKRRALAQQHSWEKRVEQLLGLVREMIQDDQSH